MIFNINGTLVNGAVSIVAARVARGTKGLPGTCTGARWLSAAVLAALALRLALAGRS